MEKLCRSIDIHLLHGVRFLHVHLPGATCTDRNRRFSQSNLALNSNNYTLLTGVAANELTSVCVHTLAR